MYAGVSACDTAQLQLEKNAASRLFGSMSKYSRVTPVLCDVLHWLPINECVNCKIGVPTYKTLNELAPSNLSGMLVPAAVSLALSKNRYAERGDLNVPRVQNTSYGNRSYTIAVPMLWNSFSVLLRRSSSMIYCCYTFFNLMQYITSLATH